MVFDPNHPTSGYALIWPKDLIRGELSALLIDGKAGDRLLDCLEWLFVEAFVGPDPVEDLRHVDPLGSWRSDNDGPWRLAALLRDNLDRIPVHARKRYYLERAVFPEDEPVTEPVVDSPNLTSPSDEALRCLERTWHQMVGELDAVGYFDRRAGDRCTDGRPEAVDEHHATMAQLLSQRCGWPVAWPDPQPNVAKEWLEEELFTLIEVVHDLIARPRYRSWHDFEGDFHYHAFNERAGQAVYRWKVNTLLAIHAPGYRIATDGEDAGLIVTTVPDPRRRLTERVRLDVPDGNLQSIEHAIALFRRRDVTIEDKRGACRALAFVLESRRPALRKHLRGKDEGALFQIANEFWIRHHDGKQHTDYAQDEFLDWVFWNYLATIELTNRLLARTTGSPTKTASSTTSTGPVPTSRLP